MSNQLISDNEINIKIITSFDSSPSQVEIPSENGISTIRSLNVDNSSNQNILEDYQNIDDSVSVNVNECFTEELPKITTMSELLKHLCELMVRFDTSPKNYQKSDFEHFIKTITNSLIYLYDNSDSGGTYTGTDSASFIGIAFPDTNPFVDAANLKNKFPGIYFAQISGDYSNFGVTVNDVDLHGNIVLLIPNVKDGIFTEYKKEIYALEIQNSYYRYSSDIKKIQWDITHNLNKFPSVVITDTAGTEFEGSITHVNNNKLIIKFSAPFKGYADLN